MIETQQKYDVLHISPSESLSGEWGSKPTGELRFLDGQLQQRVEIDIYSCGFKCDSRHEWRDVPSITGPLPRPQG